MSVLCTAPAVPPQRWTWKVNDASSSRVLEGYDRLTVETEPSHRNKDPSPHHDGTV